jgi:hypothetical protein
MVGIIIQQPLLTEKASMGGKTEQEDKRRQIVTRTVARHSKFLPNIVSHPSKVDKGASQPIPTSCYVMRIRETHMYRGFGRRAWLLEPKLVKDELDGKCRCDPNALSERPVSGPKQ